MNIRNGFGNSGQAIGLLSMGSSHRVETVATKRAAKIGANVPSSGAADAAKFTRTAGLIFQTLSGQEARSSRVQAIQATIAAGTYHVSASALADKLMSSMLGASEGA